MRAHRNAILCIAAVATLISVAADVALAQKVFSRGPSSNTGVSGPSRGGGGYYGGGGYRGGGWGGPGVIMVVPHMGPSGGQYIDDDDDLPQGRKAPATALDEAGTERGACGQRTAAGARRGGDRNRQLRQFAANRRAATPASAHSHRNRRHSNCRARLCSVGGFPIAARSPRWCVRWKPIGSSPRRSRITCSRCNKMKRRPWPKAMRRRLNRQVASAAGAHPRQGRQCPHCGDRLRGRQQSFRACGLHR